MVNHTFRGKKVLVTGHTGFKGSWLSLWLKELGATVIGYSLAPQTEHDNFVVTNLQSEVIDIRGDIRDSQKLNEVFQKYEPEIVFHLAAQPLVNYSYSHPKETYDVNVMGTLNVLEAVRINDSVKVCIMVTSDKCYENKKWVWGYREHDAMGGHDPYSSSKGCCELLISSYRNSYFPEDKYKQHQKLIASVRAGNVIGGGDWSVNRIIPDCIRALEAKEKIMVRNPKAVRPWQHVLEPLSGYLLLTEKLITEGTRFSGAWNFGPKQESLVPVEEVVTRIIKSWGSGSWDIISLQKERLYETTLLNLDTSKSNFKLNWSPRWSIGQTLDYAVEWYKNYKTHPDMRALCLNQIKQYRQIEGKNHRSSS